MLDPDGTPVAIYKMDQNGISTVRKKLRVLYFG